MDQRQPPSRALLKRLIPRIGLVWLLLPLTFVVPWLNSTAPPYFDLTGWMGVFAHGLALSLSANRGAWVVVGLMLVLVSRPGLPARRRLVELLVVGLALLALQGGGSALNEFGLKVTLQEPRPHVKQLARTPAGPPSTGSVLGMTAEAFYDQPVAERRAYLCALSGYDEIDPTSRHCRSNAPAAPDPSPRRYCFEEHPDATLHLHPRVCRHWISTTGGFSFPSGHAYSALFLAAFFWGLALRFLAGWRRWLIEFVVVPWTVLVAYSRVVLRVHTPLDITVGGLLGGVLGLAALVLVCVVLDRLGGERP